MKNKAIAVVICFAVLITSVTLVLYFTSPVDNSQSEKSGQMVALNEIDQLVKAGDTEEASQKISDLQDKIKSTDNEKRGNGRILIIGGTGLALILLVLLYVYLSVLRPFGKLEDFAENVAKGNLDIPLNYERTNNFGKFTWAFDSMRGEIKKARNNEREAMENNKVVIATLSHDIKTPIASIRAYSEALQANMDTTPEKRDQYLSVIMRKCDEVSKLTNDLFLHSLSDMEKIQVETEKMELCSCVEGTVLEMAGEMNDIRFSKPDFEVFVKADPRRLSQIVENLINNSRKYAKTMIDVSITKRDDMASIHFKDYGKGIPDEDMPFIFYKFYRGKNCGDEQGSGLGLYIVKYLTEKMGGEVILHNHADSFEAVVSLPIVETERSDLN